MNGRNASGRAVSLLNDDPQLAVPLRCETRFMGWPQSPSMCASPTNTGSIPPTPELLRSSSWSSRRTADSASPITPADIDDDDDEGKRPMGRLAPMTTLGPRPPTLLPKRSERSSPSLRVPHPLERPSSVGSEMMDGLGPEYRQGAASPTSTIVSSETSSSSSSSVPMVSGKPMPKRYPCQFADTLDCREMFTTSGHASRHAKRHTGEKNVQCPRCPKRFARKDNMKQHLKTHEGGRGVDRSNSLAVAAAAVMADDSSSCSTSSSQVASPAMEMVSPYMAAGTPAIRPPLRRSSATQHVPRRSLGSSSSMTSSSTSQRLLSPALASPSPYPSPFTAGLDALVIAADRHEHQRMSS